jgi:hypothetical protein
MRLRLLERMTSSDQTQKSIEFIQTSLFGEPEIVRAKPKRRKRQDGDRAEPAPAAPSLSKWQVRRRLWVKSARAAGRWFFAKARDKAVELVISAMLGSIAGYLGWDALVGKHAPVKQPPPVIEKGWEPKVHKGR